VVPALPEAQPSTKPAPEGAVQFLVRMVHRYLHEITIYEGGAMSKMALAISLNPEFAGLAYELVFMGGSMDPQSDYPEFATRPAVSESSGPLRCFQRATA
jgi:purine nucleosidase